MNVARFHGLAFNCGLMPALILDFYSNGNVNEFVKTKSLTDDCKLTLVPPIVNANWKCVVYITPLGQRNCPWHAISA